MCQFSTLTNAYFIDIQISQFPMISNDMVNEYIFVSPFKSIRYTEYKPHAYHNYTDST